MIAEMPGVVNGGAELGIVRHKCTLHLGGVGLDASTPTGVCSCLMILRRSLKTLGGHANKARNACMFSSRGGRQDTLRSKNCSSACDSSSKRPLAEI
jgi:hypothetical protein